MIKITFENANGEVRSYYTLDKNNTGQLDTTNVKDLEGFTGFNNDYIFNKSPGQVGENIVGKTYNRRDILVSLRVSFENHKKMREISREYKDFFQARPITITIDDESIQRKIDVQIRRIPLVPNEKIHGLGTLFVYCIAPMPYFENSIPDIIELIDVTQELQVTTISQEDPGDFINTELIQPLGFLFSSLQDEIEYNNDGDAVIPIKARFEGISVNPSLERSYIDDAGAIITDKISFEISIAVDEYIVIDTEEKTAIKYSLVDDSVIDPNLNIYLVDRTYFKLVRGINTLVFDADSGNPRVTIETNKRYEDAY